MPRDWTDDEVKKEIADAIAIVREDRFEKFARHTLGNKDGTQTSSQNSPPPSGGTNPDPNASPPAKKRSLWWGEAE